MTACLSMRCPWRSSWTALRERKAEVPYAGPQYDLIEYLEMMIRERLAGRVKRATLEVSLAQRAGAALSSREFGSRYVGGAPREKEVPPGERLTS